MHGNAAAQRLLLCYGCTMNATSDAAARRRKTWAGGLADAATASTFDASFWASASVADKLDALRTMADEVAAMEGHGTSARLQRHLGGVRRARR